MFGNIRHIYRLGLKELISFRYDPVLMVMLFYCFTVMVVVPSRNASNQVHNATVAIVDEDLSPLSERIRAAIGKPYFMTPEIIPYGDIDHSLNRGIYTFAVHIPRGFEKDVLAGKSPAVRLDVDATAVRHAKLGTAYLTRIIMDETSTFRYRSGKPSTPPVSLNVRAKFNPNRENSWFMSLVFLMQMITLLSILLPAAALIKEKERQTVEHLLVMPLNPFEISLAKVWSNSLLIVIGAMFSLVFCVKGIIGAPLIGSVPLFFLGTLVYLFAATELGIFLATIAKNLPQVGLLSMPVIVPIAMLAGGTTPLEAMPPFLQGIMKFSPAAHYLDFITAVLLRDAGLPDIWQQLAAMGAIGLVLFTAALMRFRATFR